MMAINITFEEAEYNKISKAKEIHGGNWHDFFLDLARKFYSDNVAGKEKK